ncbi:hypothetical protein C464_03362 [Halorubrum coriense DSM 10284]|uniref:Uncharacterized protein n=1 Tax=Halorubrum coriense DSM 10284 TaxID=1227466 RepID=M0EQM5_9EURY|nr:hypothetical protein [Halorubrum coriense]ELZ49985.1 hypothetical protein C464_03362 [Halorubrum coriense DSM 10284]
MVAATDRDPRRVLSKRHDTIELLLDDAYSKPELVEELGCSRSTVDRAVNELLETGCIERTRRNASRYSATTLGGLMFQAHRTYRETVDDLQSAAPVLTTMPADAPISSAIIRDAEIHRSVRTPDIAFRPAQELLPDATRMIGTAPVVYREYFQVLNRRCDRGSFELEIVMESDLSDSVAENYSAEFETLTGFDSTTVYRTDESVPYGLWVMELPESAVAGITFYNEGGVPGTIVNESADAVEWATERYAEFKRTAVEST